MKLGHKYKYIVYSLTENLGEVFVEKLGEPGLSFILVDILHYYLS